VPAATDAYDLFFALRLGSADWGLYQLTEILRIGKNHEATRIGTGIPSNHTVAGVGGGDMMVILPSAFNWVSSLIFPFQIEAKKKKKKKKYLEIFYYILNLKIKSCVKEPLTPHTHLPLWQLCVWRQKHCVHTFCK
jgi:hypothetical protein